MPQLAHIGMCMGRDLLDCSYRLVCVCVHRSIVIYGLRPNITAAAVRRRPPTRTAVVRDGVMAQQCARCLEQPAERHGLCWRCVAEVPGNVAHNLAVESAEAGM